MNTPEVIEPEVLPPIEAKLVRYASETGLEKSVSQTLFESFRPIFEKARGALADAYGVAESVKDATCVTEIKKSRTCRLAIRKIRLEADEMREKQKRDALLYGKAVQGFYNILLADLAPVEQALQDAEDTAERAEASRKAALKQSRSMEMAPLLDGPILLDLGEISETSYVKLLADAKLLKQAKIDAAAKAEADRLAREKADREERERIAAENVRLQAEAAEARRLAEAERERIEAERAAERITARAEATRLAEVARLERLEAEARIKAAADKAKAEREAIEAKARDDAAKATQEADRLRAELAAKAKAEAVAKAKADAEAKAAALAERKAKAAPDKAKLLAFADLVAGLDVPAFADDALTYIIHNEVHALASWLTERAMKL